MEDLEKLEEIKEIKHKMVLFECEDLTDKQTELVGNIVELLYDLIEELKK